MKRQIITCLLLLTCSMATITAQHYTPQWSSLDSRPLPTWFKNAKFGIFIHWGVYSVPSWRKVEPGRYASYAEWYYARVMDNKENGGYTFHRKNYGHDFDYHDFAPLFTASLFDANQWAELFAQSGARYVVLTAKHHDGFCLWPTKNPHKKGWNSDDTGPHRDLTGELAQAVRAKNIKMGLYYSIPDWESIPRKADGSEYFIDEQYVKKYGIPPQQYATEIADAQLRELVTTYSPSIIFSDAGEWIYDDNFWKTKEFLAWLYNESPCKDEVVVNDRFCKGMPGKHGDYYSSEYQDAETDASHYWEENRGIGGSYGFNRAENLADYQTSQALIHELIDIVARGGNLLLNVGPTADGRIPVIMQQRLHDIGQWLQVNGEAIYETSVPTQHNILPTDSTMHITQKQDTLYLICTRWPEKPIRLIVYPDKKYSVTMLGSEQTVATHRKKNILTITPPLFTPNSTPCEHAWCFKLIPAQ